MTRRRIYVAGALTAMACDYIKNLHRMNRVAEQARRAGFAVFNPGQDFVTGIQFGDMDYADYADNNMAWLEVSDAVLVVPHSENSKGTAAEVARAEELCIPHFKTLAAMVSYFRLMEPEATNPKRSV